MRFVHFMRDGGWAMWFVLAFGLITLLAAAGFALRPEPEREAPVRSFTRATAFAIFTAVSADLAIVGHNGPRIFEFATHPAPIVLEGISESLAPSILGFALLSFAWIVMAIGHRRQARA